MQSKHQRNYSPYSSFTDSEADFKKELEDARCVVTVTNPIMDGKPHSIAMQCDKGKAASVSY